VKQHVLELTGVQIDESGKDLARLCFLSYDPNLYHNASATEIKPLPEPVRPKPITNDMMNLSERQRVATGLLGAIDWQSETEGYCVCPNQAAHTTGNGARDCKVWLGEIPTISCFHNSCRGVIEGLNFTLRSRIGKAEAPAKTAGMSDRACRTLGAQSETGNGSKANMTQLSSVAMLPIEFVDKPLFQANAFHLLVGKKNAGKGTFLSAVASRFTRGELGDKRNAIWVAAGEDSLAIDVHPRIKAAGGDATRVYCSKGVIPRLPSDIPLLREWIAQIGDVGLVVLDPIGGMLRGGTNTNLDNDVRCAISPLNELADAEKCLIIGVRHLKKDASQGALDSILGSADWANIPRAVLAMVMDDEDEDIRHVQVVAGNRLPRGSASRSFRIVGVKVVEGGEPVAKAEFISDAGKDVDEVLRAEPGASDTKIKRGKIALLDKIEQADGTIESDTWTADVASETGISARTLRNAKTWLRERGLISFSPDKDEAGKVIRWNVRRTNAPRPSELDQATCHSPSLTQNICHVDGKWMSSGLSGYPHDIQKPCFETQGVGMSSGSADNGDKAVSVFSVTSHDEPVTPPTGGMTPGQFLAEATRLFNATPVTTKPSKTEGIR
jgi:hypothetical protein